MSNRTSISNGVCTILTTLLIVLSTQAFPQKKVDSLKQELIKTPFDNQRVFILYELGVEYLTDSIKLSQHYAEKMMELAESYNFQMGIAQAHSLQGGIYYYNGKKEAALAEFFKAESVRKLIRNQDRQIQNRRYLDVFYIGCIYADLGQFDKAIEYFEIVLNYRKKFATPLEVSNIYESIGEIYTNKGNYSVAIENYTKSLELRETYTNDPYVISCALNNIGTIYYYIGEFKIALSYFKQSINKKIKAGEVQAIANNIFNIGAIYVSLEEFDSAEVYFQKALEMQYNTQQDLAEITNHREISRTLGAQAIVYKHKKEYKKALTFYEESIRIKTEISDHLGVAVGKNNLAALYLALGQFKKAEQLSLESLETAKQLDALTDVILAYEVLADIYVAQGRFQKAIESLCIRQKYYDEQMGLENIEKIAEITASYEEEKRKRKIAENNLKINKKELTIKLQQAEVSRKTFQRNLLLSVSLLLTILIGLIVQQIIRRSKQQEEKTSKKIVMYMHEIELLKANQEILDLSSMKTSIQSKCKQKLNDFLVNPLTSRELEVLKWICRGFTNKQIADEIFVSVHTIRNHNRHIFEKLDVKNRSQAMVMVSSFELENG